MDEAPELIKKKLKEPDKKLLLDPINMVNNFIWNILYKQSLWKKNESSLTCFTKS